MQGQPPILSTREAAKRLGMTVYRMRGMIHRCEGLGRAKVGGWYILDTKR